MEMHAHDSQASWIYLRFAFTIHYLSFNGFYGKNNTEVMEKK